MRVAAFCAGLILAALPVSARAEASRADCSELLPTGHLPVGQRRLVPEDLVRLRDIGPPDPQGYADPFFTLSPDGRRVAFQLRRADPHRNGYCLAMVVIDLSGNRRPTIVDEGGEPILLTLDFRGIADFPTGHLRAISPRWSADGHWFAFLKRVRGRTQVWRALADGSGSAPVTRSPLDVTDFRIAADGTSIVYAVRPGVERDRQKLEQEGLDGWRYDDRFVPAISKHPLPTAPAAREIRVVDIAGGADRPATAEEAAPLASDTRLKAIAGAPAVTAGGLEIASTTISGGARAGSFRARDADGGWVACPAASCEGAINPWWAVPGAVVRYFRPEGWAKSSTAIHEWDLRTNVVRRLYSTDDVLSSCAPSGARLLCRIDSSLEPGRLVWLDLKSGQRTTLFDPNPEFARLTLGRPERLHLRNRFGIESIADLVLPVGYVRGRKYPMVVVQYETRGFLRGGTADEYPIQAFANRGYAVLSFKRPFLPSLYLATNAEQAGKENLKDFADRKNVQASLEEAVKLAVDRGVADPARLGITGLSDGTSTVDWALIHSRLFAAAATSSCCWDPSGVWQVGPSAARHFAAEGYPGALGTRDPIYRDISLSENVDRLSAPILINAAESELLDALFTYTALREAHHPADLFVYPGEYHARWQPAHRLATYRRSLDWFDYWLGGVRSPDPARADEIKVWDELRADARRRDLRRADQGEAPNRSSSATPGSTPRR